LASNGTKSCINPLLGLNIAVAETETLLEGENPATTFRQDARHWIAVYRQMITFKHDLLGRIRSQVGALPRAGAQDVIDNDVRILEVQLRRYERRIEFWYARQWELEGLSIEESSRTIAYRDRSVQLTRREYQLFVRLADHSPGYTTASQLLLEAWHDPGLPQETVRTYIARLRRKLAMLGAPVQVVNRSKRGYSLAFDDRPAEVAL
jgi:hypothetical protein